MYINRNRIETKDTVFMAIIILLSILLLKKILKRVVLNILWRTWSIVSNDRLIALTILFYDYVSLNVIKIITV